MSTDRNARAIVLDRHGRPVRRELWNGQDVISFLCSRSTRTVLTQAEPDDDAWMLTAEFPTSDTLLTREV